ncbi:MAG TPA: hypothetical protein PKK20_11830, partial [Verrucomicrobiota bacterium]|nr:hypothetical protein [Verrucomicrobiota bacterium]
MELTRLNPCSPPTSRAVFSQYSAAHPRPGDRADRDGRAAPAEQIAVALVKRRSAPGGRREERNPENLEAGAIDVFGSVETDIAKATEGIDPASQTVIRATKQRHTVFDSPEGGVG